MGTSAAWLQELRWLSQARRAPALALLRLSLIPYHLHAAHALAVRHLLCATCCFSSQKCLRARHARGSAFLAMSTDSDGGETRQPHKADREYALQGLQGLERAGAHQVPMVVWARARTCKRALPLVQGNPGCGETWDSASGNGTFAFNGLPVSWYDLQLQLARCTQWQPPQVRSRFPVFPPSRQLGSSAPSIHPWQFPLPPVS